MNLHHLGVLARFELNRSFLSTRGVLFLAIYGILWFWFLWKLSEGWATKLTDPDALRVVSWLLDAELARVLFVEHSASLSVFFLSLMAMVPVFTMWGAGDQTATDIGTRHLRFLIHRCGRTEIYVGRFLGALCFMAIVHAVVTLAGVGVALYVDGQSVAIGYGLRTMLVGFLYTLPYVAFMSFFGALTGSAAAAILLAVASYTVTAIAASIMSLNWDQARYVAYFFPSPFKGDLLAGQGMAYATGLAALAGYTVAYFALGWLIFSRRDI